MNYLAHAYRFLDKPYFVAGVALPDWLSVVGRQYRARSNSAKQSLKMLDESNACLTDTERSFFSDFLQGVIQHHFDDDLFHQNQTFILMSAKLSVALRSLHGTESSIRSGFLGHIVIELLLDDYLSQTNQSLLEQYYQVVDSVDRKIICAVASKVVGKEVTGLDNWIDRFVSERFLEDYSDDKRLLRRLNQIMKRVGLEQLEDETLDWLSFCRKEVHAHAQSLLNPEVIAT